MTVVEAETDATRTARMQVCAHTYVYDNGGGGGVRCQDCGFYLSAAAHPANPWAGRVVCPGCDSSEWTLPYDPTVPGTSWRCVACHCWVDAPMNASS